MREATGDLFALLERGRKVGRRVAICIPKNGMTKANGEAVMGRGLALGGSSALATAADAAWMSSPGAWERACRIGSGYVHVSNEAGLAR